LSEVSVMRILWICWSPSSSGALGLITSAMVSWLVVEEEKKKGETRERRAAERGAVCVFVCLFVCVLMWGG
jgi:hypothetical protein